MLFPLSSSSFSSSLCYLLPLKKKKKNQETTRTALLESIQRVGGEARLTGGLASGSVSPSPNALLITPAPTQKEEGSLQSARVVLLPWGIIPVLAVALCARCLFSVLFDHLALRFLRQFSCSFSETVVAGGDSGPSLKSLVIVHISCQPLLHATHNNSHHRRAEERKRQGLTTPLRPHSCRLRCRACVLPCK